MASDFNQPVTPQPAFQPNPPPGPPFGGPGMELPQKPWETGVEPPRRRKWGCIGCLLGCLGVSIICGILIVIAGMWTFRRLPDLARKAIDSAVQQSDLTPEDKQVVMQQVDRLVDGYKTGKIDGQRMGRFMEQLAESPLMDLMIAYAAKANYIDPSGLSPDEKQQAERTLQRVVRGVVEEKITKDELNTALDAISTDKGNGAREFHDKVTDEQLREFLAELKQLADNAQIPDEEYQIDIGGELKKLVDEALGESSPGPAQIPTAEAPASDTVPPQSDSPDSSRANPDPAEARSSDNAVPANP